MSARSIFDAALGARLRDRAHELAMRGACNPRALVAARLRRASRTSAATTPCGWLDARKTRQNGTRWWRSMPCERHSIHRYTSARDQRNCISLAMRPAPSIRTHRDRFRDDDARLITLVFYLNDDWAPVLVAFWCFIARRQRSGARPRAAARRNDGVFRSELFPHGAAGSAGALF